MVIIRVALDVPIDRLFDYLAPDADTADIGRCVRVPFSSRQISGIIISVCETSSVPEGKLKYAGQIDRQTPPLPQPLLGLFEFCSRYYHHPIGQVVMNGLPVLLRKFKHTGKEQPPSWRLTDTGKSITLADLPIRAKAKRQLISLLSERGIITAEICKAMSSHSRKL